VDTKDRNDVISFFQNVYQASEGYEAVMNWTGNHGTCSEGTVSSAFVDMVQRRVNYYRAMAGVPASVAMNTASTVVTADDPYGAASSVTKVEASRKSALLISRNKLSTHDPVTSSSCFTAAAGNGSFFGNITLGFYGPGAMDAYMKENASNLDAGHRRWLLYTQATDFATGDVPYVNINLGEANTLYVRQRSTELATVSPRFIPWPNAGYCPWNHATEFWSLSYPGAGFSAATVSVTKAGVAQTVSNVRKNQLYGNNSITWQVENLAIGGADTTYQVTVSGMTGTNVPTTHTYEVTFFNPDLLLTTPKLDGEANPPVTGGKYALTGVNIAEEYRLEVGEKSALSEVEGAEDATSSLVIEGPVKGYSQRSTSIVRSGAKAFRLGVASPEQTEQWIELDRVILPQASSALRYHRMIAFISSGTTFVWQYAVNDNGDWKDFPGSAKAGSSPLTQPSNITEGSYTSQLSHSFPSEAIGVPTRVRMLIRRAPGDEFTAGDAENYKNNGVFIDDISFSNCDWLSRRVLTSIPATAKEIALDATSAGKALTNGAQYTLRVQPRVGSKWMTASPLLNVFVGSAPNKAPTLAAISDPLAILEDAGEQSISLSDITAGGEVQEVKVIARSSNPALIPDPVVDYTNPNSTGRLRYKPVANASGSAVITVTVDDGQAENNQVSRSFNVAVTAVNDPVGIVGLQDMSIAEDTNTGLVPFSLADPDSPLPVMTITATSSDLTLVPVKSILLAGTGANRTVKITPALNRSGTSLITLVASDKTTRITTSFTLTVTEVNDLPILAKIGAPKALKEDSLPSIVAFSGLSAGANELQPLTVTATSSNPSIIPNPVVNYTSPSAAGSFSITPAPNQSGTATITLTISDNGSVNNTITRTMLVSVAPVNDAPTISPIVPWKMVKNSTSAPIPFTVGDLETAPGALTVTAVTSNKKLFAPTGIVFSGSGANRFISLTRIANAIGTATVTVTVKDEKLTAVRTFLVTVNATETYATWVANRYPGLVEDGFAGDFDEDGLSNGAEYALALNPTEVSILGAQSHSLDTGLVEITIPLLEKKSDVVYAAEYSADGMNWSSDGITVTHASAILKASVTGSATGSLRWKITQAVDWSEIAGSRSARKGNHIADVCHTCGKHQHAFEAKAEACVRHTAVTAKIHIPPVILWIEVMAFHVF
jgi:hypothetical protein